MVKKKKTNIVKKVKVNNIALLPMLIFLLAGMFVGVVGRGSASSVAYFVLSHMPAKFAVMVLFIVSFLYHYQWELQLVPLHLSHL